MNTEYLNHFRHIFHLSRFSHTTRNHKMIHARNYSYTFSAFVICFYVENYSENYFVDCSDIDFFFDIDSDDLNYF